MLQSFEKGNGTLWTNHFKFEINRYVIRISVLYTFGYIDKTNGTLRFHAVFQKMY